MIVIDIITIWRKILIIQWQLFNFTWGINKGFSVSLLIEYNVFDRGHTYEIPLDKVPKKQYGDYELYNIDVIFEIGIELFNANFDES